MTDSKFSYLAKLKEPVASMERDLGLVKFSNDELNVICALRSMSSDDSQGVKSSELKSHVLCSSISNPTFYRVLRGLLDQGAVVRFGELKTGSYRLADTYL